MLTLIGFLPIGIAELMKEDGDLEIDESVSLPGVTELDVVPLKECIPQTCWRGARKAFITMLGETMSFLL